MKRNRPGDSNLVFSEIVPGTMGFRHVFCRFRFQVLFFPFQNIPEQFL